ncbi:hypothetical protein [uncultured Ferrimonas sp.]|uniref:hypothetical protein n=1 Tax=uncultured Ferrimonas sp. TaxID=432640 RepID=UPI0026237ADA|nr:hypothetical protein [uncultured Ferrimonas sp.]
MAKQPKGNTLAADGVDESSQYEILVSANAPKLRDKSKEIQYEIGKQGDGLAIRIVANDGGGLFSNEWVEIESLTDLLSSLSNDTPFSSKVFDRIFTQKGNNNAGFMAAILRYEGAIKPAPNKLYQHLINIEPKTLAQHLTEKS